MAMASVYVLNNLLSYPQVVARSRTKTRNPKSNFKSQRSSKHNYKSLSLSSPSSEAEATTYTRLPLKEDFSAPSFDVSEVKLSQSYVAKSDAENSSSLVEELDSEDEEHGQGLSYDQFDVFDGDSDSEEDEDYDSGQIFFDPNGEMVKLYEVDGVSDEKGEMVEPTDNEDELEVKEKGLPAVMRCFDRAKIYVKAGDGGNGVVAFRREKYVPMGGPSGGDGGRGGNVYVEVDPAMNSLLPFRKSVHFRAGRGSHGQGRMLCGAKGEDVVVKVAPGTVIRAAETGEVLLELVQPGQRAMLLPGGRGGRGNASFKSGNNKVPRIAENGEAGHEMWVDLELKLVADVGIIGAPNAGKSTLLSVISAAQPKIANYPFTTLLPNLGVVSFDYDSTMVVADLPGLLEGAHRGFGLGHEFLRHTERCSALVHVVDGSSEQPELEFEAVRLELELFSPELAMTPFVVAFNKMDLPEAEEKWPSFRETLRAQGIEPFCMSAVKREGTHKVMCAAYELLKSRGSNKEFEGLVEPANLNHVADMIKEQRSASISEFDIVHDSSSQTWHVTGTGLQRFVQMTNWRYVDSERRFQHVLEACGVYRSLMRLGVKEGDTVIVGEMEMVWHDSAENSGSANVKKEAADSSIKWPQWK